MYLLFIFFSSFLIVMENRVVLSCGTEVDASEAIEITYGFHKGELFHVDDAIEITYGYLRGYVVPKDDTVYTYDDEVVMSDDATYCESDGEYYADTSDLAYVSCGYNRDNYYHMDDVVYCDYDGEYYHTDSIGHYIYLHSDGEYRDYEEENGYCHDYHCGDRHDLTTSDTQFTIGFEVEKEDLNVLERWDLSDVDDTKWVRETDSSLDDDSGFELVSPTYDLMTDDLDNDVATDILTAHINASHSSRCGGHINFGIKGLNGSEVYDKVQGFVPVILSLYQRRLRSRYCSPKKEYKYGDGKFSAVHVKSGYIEFRVPSAVLSVSNLLWRRDLLRIMAKNTDKGTLFFIREMLTPTSELHKHLLKVVDAPTINRRAAFAAALGETMTGHNYAKWVTYEGFAEAKESLKATAEGLIS